MSATDDIRDELAGWTIGSGYYRTSVGTDEAREMSTAVVAAIRGMDPATLADLVGGRVKYREDRHRLTADGWPRISARVVGPWVADQEDQT